MKVFLFALIILLFNSITNGQNDTSQYLICYNVSHLIDSTNTKSVIQYPLYLFSGKRLSYSISKNQYINDSINKYYKSINTISGITIDNSTRQIKRLTSYESAIIYKDTYTSKFYETNQIAINKFSIEDSIKPINWEIQQFFKEIEGLSCQLATAYYKGRKWSAWFCSQIPISNGPWKLGGLPGLILEAYDNKKEISFIFTSINQQLNNNIIEIPNQGYTSTTKEKFYKLLSDYAENPLKFFETQFGFSITNGEVDFSNGASLNRSVKLKLPNNPIELSEK